MENFCVKDMMESKRHPNGWVGPSYPLDPPVPALLHILGLFEISDAYHINIFYHVETIAHQHSLTVECKRHTYIIYIHFKAKPEGWHTPSFFFKRLNCFLLLEVLFWCGEKIDESLNCQSCKLELFVFYATINSE